MPTGADRRPAPALSLIRAHVSEVLTNTYQFRPECDDKIVGAGKPNALDSGSDRRAALSMTDPHEKIGS